MARLQEMAQVIRSKNAGPFLVTLDIMFDDAAAYRKVKASGLLTASRVASLYRVAEEDATVVYYDPASAIKITLPRLTGSGDVGDTDVFGAQQHAPLLGIEVPTSGDGLLARERFPFLRDVTYLDSAAVGPVARETLDAMVEYYTSYPLNYGVGHSELAEVVVQRVDAARQTLADMVGASSPSELIFAKNTTECINLVARGIRWEAGDEIIISDLEHQSNAIPWYMAARQSGAIVKVARSDSDHLVAPDEVRRLLSPRTRLVALTYLSNLFGSVQYVEEIGRLTRERGILYFVDAAQAGGRWPVHVDGCDFMAFCGRKSWLGPQASAFLYVRADAAEALQPLEWGSRAAMLEADGAIHFKDSPYRFEAGILPTADVIGLGRAAQLLAETGLHVIRDYIRSLSTYLIERLSSLPVDVIACLDPERQGGVISWAPRNRDLRCDDLARALFSQSRIICAAGALGAQPALARVGVPGVVRTSLHVFNSRHDLDELVAALEDLLTQ